jgi:hypothetical protein
MVWISLLILLTCSIWAAPLPQFLTKHSTEAIRFITMDGRYAYVKKRPGVLGMVSSFRSIDFASEAETSDFKVVSSRFKKRLVIEVIPSVHTEYNFYKKNKILLVDWGGSTTKEIGFGTNAKLHLQDEWLTYFDPIDRVVHIVNVVTQKRYQVTLAKKTNPYFRPDVEMITSENLVYTDINEAGLSAFISLNLATSASSVIYRSSQSGTRLELCQARDYLAIGEFPYEGVERNSQILHIPLSSTINLAGYTNIYSSSDQDLGNMICLDRAIYFVKTLSEDKKLGIKSTEAVRLDPATKALEVKSTLSNVSQLIEMDGRVLIPFRGDFYVVEGTSNLGTDQLKPTTPSLKEELPLDL